MTGLEQILHQIEAEAQHNAAQIAEQAEEEIQHKHQQAQKQLQQLEQEVHQKASHQSEDILARSRSAMQLEGKKRLLAEKLELIDSVLEQALKRLGSLREEVYFSVIVELAAQFAQPEAGEILFSPEDLDRLPAGLENRLNRALEPIGGTLEISSETCNCPGGGFVLRYGGLEQNCRFEALFDTQREQLQDLVNRILFSE